MRLLEVSENLCARPMVLVAVSLAAGIILGHTGGLPIILGAFLLLGFVLFSLVKSRNEIVRNRRLLLLFLLILSFLVGLIRIRDTEELFSDIYFPDKAVKDTFVKAVVSDISLGKDQYILILDNPQIFGKNLPGALTAKNESGVDILTETGEGSVSVAGKIMVYSEALDNAKAGDQILVKGSLYAFSKATNNGQFDQRSYYLAKGIVLKLYADELSVLKRNGTIGGRIKGWLFDVSEGFQNGLKKIFDGKDMGILSAMLVGNRSELDDSTKGLYQRMGIAHILSISGLHITLIGMGLFNLLMKLTKRLRFSSASTIVFLFLYGLLTGFSVSTVRAFLMLALALTARLIGKAYDGQSAAGTAAVIILAFNPFELFESGFQLSFIAVFGIFAGNEIRKNLEIRNKIFAYILPALSASVSTFPVILRNYYSFSPYSIIANIILLPFISIIVVSGFAAGMLGYAALAFDFKLLEVMAQLAAGPAHFLLLGYEKVSDFLLGLPMSDVITGSPDMVRCIIFYIFLFLLVLISFMLRIKRRKNTFYSKTEPVGKKKKRNGAILSVYAVSLYVMLTVLLFRLDSSGLYSAFIDVGQGLSVYLEADGKSILMDGGSSNVKEVGKYRIEPFLLWRGVSELECCFISHTDEDHISGVRELIADGRIKIKNLVVGGNYDESEPLVALAKEYGINVLMANAGDGIVLDEEQGYVLDLTDGSNDLHRDDMMIKALSPDNNFIYEDKNQASLVLYIRYKDISLLFTGDSDVFAESEYVRYLEAGKVNILQCPHHGSKYSCSELLLNTVHPDITVVSCSKTNIYGHPAPETLERLENAGSECYITAQNGMITIKYDGSGIYSVRGYNE